MRHLWVTLASLAVLLFARGASAHAAGVSRGEYRASDRVVQALYAFSGTELATTFPSLDADHDGKVTPAEIASGARALDDGVVKATIVAADDVPCASHFDSARVTEADAVEIRATFTCDHPPRHLAITCAFLDRFSGDHRHLAVIELGARESTAVAALSHEKVEAWAGPGSRPSTSFAQMLATGVRHILTGYDHLAFLVGLLLLGGRVRSLVGIVTAFTIAHSITLCLATLRIVTLSPSVVEPAIALSIAYVGIENLFVRDASKRWRITFPFGLLHGFGFAGALTELDLPRAQLPAALFAFNLGVEVGQLGVLSVVLPLVLLARRSEWFRRWGVKGLSVGIAVAGVAWCVARL